MVQHSVGYVKTYRKHSAKGHKQNNMGAYYAFWQDVIVLTPQVMLWHDRSKVTSFATALPKSVHFCSWLLTPAFWHGASFLRFICLDMTRSRKLNFVQYKVIVCATVWDHISIVMCAHAWIIWYAVVSRPLLKVMHVWIWVIAPMQPTWFWQGSVWPSRRLWQQPQYIVLSDIMIKH